MRIEISVPRSGVRRWHRHLAERLARNVDGAEVRLQAIDGGPPLDPAAESLLWLERMVLRRSRETLADRLTEIPAELRAPDGFAADVRVDCTGSAATDLRHPAARTLRPRYDGDCSERALVATVLTRSLPQIEIEEVEAGHVAAWGSPSGEAASGLTGGIEAVVSRVMVLVEQVLRSHPQADGRTLLLPVLRPVSSSLGYAMRNLATNCARSIFRLCLHSPHWRIGWRLHDGPGVMERMSLDGPRWQVLADPGRRFFADPFPVTWAGRTVLFFEDLDHRVGKGVISALEFDSSGPVGEAVPVLEEPWHMSYPFLIEHDGALFMVPESSLSGSVPIYRCIDFPRRWDRVGTLLDGVEAADCTVFKHGGLFWMMSATREGVGGYSDMLSIHYSKDLLGPWLEHARRPALVDVAAARPAGAVVERLGRLWRPVQDCSRGYGRSLVLAEIDRLDPREFEQTIHRRIEPGPLWPGKHLHTLNRFGRLECIDGTTYNPKLALARGFAGRLSMPDGKNRCSELQQASC